ncbi:hypothetical protein BDW74DRAFT_160498 [Aspergillus multicolor]|uniref:uncharacterized protein n=1 Tax=Aspergillus multicolor TaxID=41759 RepID=UPI003CCCC868
MSSAFADQTGDTTQDRVLQVINNFYTLLDGESPQAAQEWSDMFDQDGEFVTPVSTLTGRKAIRAQREEFWTQFPGLKHQPIRVYTSPFSPLDVVVINTYKFDKGEEHVLAYTAAEFKLVESGDNKYVIQRLEIFMDPTVLGWK